MAQSYEKLTTEELFRKYREKESPKIRDEIINRHLYLAEVLSRKYVGRGIDYEDLYQVAAYGLVLAVTRFDVEKGTAFTSFAMPTIIGEIKKYFRDTRWSLKVPRRLKEISMKIIEFREQFLEENGRVPTVRELSESIGVAEEEILEALESSQAYSAYSLEYDIESITEGEPSQLEKFLGSKEYGYETFEDEEVLESVIKDLSQTEKEIIRKRFLQEISQREVAEALGISQMTVSRIEKAMIEKFRNEYNR
ncbi:MAG: SigB/SigF/SigG family RNA polymerase sigma factor [Clostridiales bacterium]|nr:SigB/SigF/SigG family RNA polymerase sigma factor [Clostridiales bacterium]